MKSVGGKLVKHIREMAFMGFWAAASFFYGFSNPTADRLLKEELSTVEPEDRLPIFGELQRLGADEVPLIPLIQADQVAAVREGVTGVEDTFDASTIFRYWLVSPPAE